MTSSETSETTDLSTTPVATNIQSTKRLSATMSPPHSVPWVPSDSAPESQEHEQPVKTMHKLASSETDPIKRPWSNKEQEALYVAVQRHKLFGRWSDIKDQMQLDRTVVEIEQEYMRLYGELPESEDEDWPEDDTGAVPVRSHIPGHLTPALTSTSSSSLSARSSLETFNNHLQRPTVSEHPHPPYRKYSASHPVIDDDHDDENDESMMDTEMPSPPSRPLTGKGSTSQSRSTGAIADTKPTRTVRVWTQQQSQQLKNLIEDCFPGGYRINWVWVASQMGNTFTRKQCKNKWEIMRRRAGTEEEISLLKKGHEEFGPSWSKIQEKYLPERSQGGISIMWSLLQAREAEQKQQAEKATHLAHMGHRADTRLDYEPTGSASLSPVRQRNETRPVNDVRRKASPQEKSGGPLRRKSADRDRPYRSRAPTHSMPDGPEGRRHSLSDREMMDRHPGEYHSFNEPMSRETSLSPIWRREGGSNAISPPTYSTSTFRDGPHAKRFSVSSTDSYSGQQERHYGSHHQQYQHHAQHPYQQQQQQQQHRQYNAREQTAEMGTELWSERNRPMTWTGPLTRRLEDIIHQHFPNHQKVNWVKVSALMGSNPVVTKEQCKRRWYLMSQYEHLRSRPSETMAHDAGAGDMTMDMDMAGMGLESRRDGHPDSTPSSPVPSLGSPPSKRSLEYVPWSEQEVELLKRGVEEFGRSWTEIQQHYLKDRSVSSMASKWDYLMRVKTPSSSSSSSSRPHPGQLQGVHHHHRPSYGQVSPGADFSRGGDMEDEQTSHTAVYAHLSADREEH